YEGMTALDLIGPAEVLAGQGFSVDYVSRDKKPVYAESRSNRRLGLVPTATFSDINTTDIICVPGTSNPYIQIKKNDMMEWVSLVGKRLSGLPASYRSLEPALYWSALSMTVTV
ncbi:hypothetical protein ADUPG1_003515, partial [Aduncisulcus paluster]